LTFEPEPQSPETVGELGRVEAQQGFRLNAFNDVLTVELDRVRAELYSESEATARLKRK
jgi:hypothetical protein